MRRGATSYGRRSAAEVLASRKAAWMAASDPYLPMTVTLPVAETVAEALSSACAVRMSTTEMRGLHPNVHR